VVHAVDLMVVRVSVVPEVSGAVGFPVLFAGLAEWDLSLVRAYKEVAAVAVEVVVAA